LSKSLGRNAAINALRVCLQIIFPLISFPYASRVLMPEGLGKVAFSSSLVAYFAILANFGVTNYAMPIAAKLRDNRHELSCFVYEMLLTNGIALLISYGLLYLLMFTYEPLFAYRGILLIQSVSIVFTIIGMEWLYVAMEDFGYITIRSFVFQLLALVALFVFVRKPTDIIPYACINIFSSVGSNVINFINARKYLEKIRFSELNIGKHLKRLSAVFLFNALCSIYNLLDTTILGLISGDRAVGLYTSASKIVRLVLNLLLAVTAVFLPRLSFNYSKSGQEYRRLATNEFNLVSLLAFPFSAGLALLSTNILRIMSGPGFIEAAQAMVVLSLLLPIVGISNVLSSQIFFIIGKEYYATIASFFSAIVDLALNLFLIPRMGYLGAAIACVSAEATGLVICLFISRRFVDLSSAFGELWKPLVATVTIAGLYWLVWPHISKLGIIAGILIYIVLSIVFYAGVLLLTRHSYFMFQVKRLLSKAHKSKIIDNFDS